MEDWNVQNRMKESRAEEPGNILAASAPAPDFVSKRLQLQVFPQVAPAPTLTPGIFLSGSGSWILVRFGEIFSSPRTTNVNLHEI